ARNFRDDFAWITLKPGLPELLPDRTGIMARPCFRGKVGDPALFISHEGLQKLPTLAYAHALVGCGQSGCRWDAGAGLALLQQCLSMQRAAFEWGRGKAPV